MHITGSRPSLHKKKENVLALASHDGGPAFIYHPSGSIDILKPPLWPGLLRAAQAARRHRDDDALLVNVEPNVNDPVRHDPSPIMRLGTGQSAATLVTCIL
jgi:hypothetical protein